MLGFKLVSGCKLMILNDISRHLWGLKRSGNLEVHGGVGRGLDLHCKTCQRSKEQDSRGVHGGK